MEGRSLIVGGVRMHWQEAGSGPPLILLHGIPTSPQLWRRVVPRLADFRVLAWSLVGFGEAMEHAGQRDLSLRAQAEYLQAWMNAMGIDQAIVVGHDLGGGVAQILAARHPERIRGLVLVNCVTYDSWPIPSVLLMQKSEPLLRFAPNALVRVALWRAVRRLHDDVRIARESFALHWEHYSRHKAGRVLAHQVHALDNRDTLSIVPLLRRLQVPARVVWGTAGVQDISYARRLAEDLSTELIRVEGANHFVPEDHPEAVVDAIRQVQLRIAVEERQRSGAPLGETAPPPL